MKLIITEKPSVAVTIAKVIGAKERKSGYFEEKWHWTYMPLSKKYTDMAKKWIKNEMISGFLGAETATKVDMVNNYILSISPACLQITH